MGADGILVSVVMPVYNAAQYIGKAIRSLLSVVSCEVEVIVIDDGSTDDLEGAVRGIGSERVRFVRREENCGYGACMAMGVEMSKSEYVCRADADDFSARQRLDAQLLFLKDHPEIAFVGTRRWLMSPSGRRLGISEWPPGAGDWLEETWQSVFTGRRYFTDPSVMVRREALEAVGGWRSYQRSGMDVDLWLRLMERGYRGATLRAPLYFRRLHPDGLVFSENTGVKNALVRKMAEERRRCGTDAVMRGEAIEAGSTGKVDEWAIRRRHGSFQWSIGGDCAAKCDFVGAYQFALAALGRCGVAGITTKGFLRFFRGLCFGGSRILRLWWWRTRKRMKL